MGAWLWLTILVGCGGETGPTTNETATADTGSEPTTTSTDECRRAATADSGGETSGGCG